MKKFFLLSALALAVLVSCKSGGNTSNDKVGEGDSESSAAIKQDGKFNMADVTTFGLMGKVKEITVTTKLISHTPPVEMDFWTAEDKPQFAFDEYGRVLLDGDGCKYEYDSLGNFIKGHRVNTVFNRDEKGRVKFYDNTVMGENEEYSDVIFEQYFCRDYTYDDNNRVITEDAGGWEWGTVFKYEYEGGNVYPSKVTYESGSEGVNSIGTITYEYLAFDAKGNWTERRTTVANSDTEEGSDAPAEISNRVTKETRKITYYE